MHDGNARQRKLMEFPIENDGQKDELEHPCRRRHAG